MDPERWKKIEQLCNAALERKEAEREVFLKEACEGDEGLFDEVNSILRQQRKAEGFIETPAFELEAQRIAEDRISSVVGQKIGSYKVLSPLGQGGMGEVYLAEDTSLERKVAIKFLPEYLENDEVAQTRFIREAKSAAAIDHPYICKIHEVGEVGNRHFIVMEYVKGETLKDRLAKGPIPHREALKIAIEVCEAIREAHRKKIVHRDLKPANIMLTADNHPKVMDFGLAKRIREDQTEVDITAALTREGSTLGTLTYMSPEQLRGEPVDTRSDLFAFGIVLYEMLTGTHPFRKATQAQTVNAIFSENPPPLSTYSEDSSDILQHTVQKLLAKDPNRRYQSIHEVITNLDQLTEDTGKTGLWPVVKAKFYLNLRWVVAATLIAAATVTVLMIWNLQEPEWTEHGAVVADFDTGIPDFDQVLENTLRTELDKTGKTGIMAMTSQHEQRWLECMFKPPDTRFTPDVARDMCECWAEPVQTFFHGTVLPLGDSYQLTLNAEWCKIFGWVLQEERTVASKEEVVEALRDATHSLAERVINDLNRFERKPGLVWYVAGTPSMEALRLYTQGGRAFSQGDTSGGFGLLQEAVEIDPEFAAAHAYLGARYRESGQLKLAQEHTARAYEFRDRLKHTTEVPLIEMDYFESVKFDLESAIQAGRKGQQKQTTSPWHNMLLAGLLIEAGRPEEGLDVARIGFQGSDHYLLAHNYLILNRLSEAKADLERRFLEEPEKHKERLYLWIIAFLEGDQELLDREERWIDTKLSDGSVDLVRLHQTFYHGQFRRGRQLLDDLIIFLNQQKRAELGDRLLREQAWVEAIVGNHRRSRDYLALPVDVNDTHLEQVLGSAYTLTLLGEPEQAESLLEDARKLYPDATLLKNLHTPTIGAMIESRRGDPESAHERLRPAALYEKAPQADKYKLISGQILLELKRGDEAVEAFQKIVDNPGQITYFFRRQKPVSSWIELPVAQVGLARAKTISGDVTGARAAYEQFFEMWKDADEDIPLLVEAKAEYNRLTTDN